MNGFLWNTGTMMESEWPFAYQISQLPLETCAERSISKIDELVSCTYNKTSDSPLPQYTTADQSHIVTLRCHQTWRPMENPPFMDNFPSQKPPFILDFPASRVADYRRVLTWISVRTGPLQSPTPGFQVSSDAVDHMVSYRYIVDHTYIYHSHTFIIHCLEIITNLS